MVAGCAKQSNVYVPGANAPTTYVAVAGPVIKAFPAGANTGVPEAVVPAKIWTLCGTPGSALRNAIVMGPAAGADRVLVEKPSSVAPGGAPIASRTGGPEATTVDDVDEQPASTAATSTIHRRTDRCYARTRVATHGDRVRACRT